jgi:dolichyl-phosphate-mannose-protein mannosyltransferase
VSELRAEARTLPIARTWPVVERRHIRDLVAIVGLVLAAVGIPLWMSAAAGAIGLPTNDDWVYMHAANSLFQTGRLDISGHTTAFLGQLALIQPFLWVAGGQAWAFTAFGLVMTGIGIAATYFLARRYLGVGSAVMVCLLVIVFPGFARSAASFMTDIPTYALIMLCLLVGTGWVEDRSGRARLVIALAIGLLAASIREFALAAPLAVLLAAWARSWRTDRAWLAGVSTLFGVGIAGVLSVSAALPGHGTVTALQVGSVIDLGPAFATLAAVLLPAAILYVGRRIEGFTRTQVLVAVAVVCFVVFHPNGPILGNLWTPFGLAANNVLAGGRDWVIGSAMWGMSRQAALFAAMLAAAIVLNWADHAMAGKVSLTRARAVANRVMRSREGPLALFLVGYAVELVLFSLLGGLFDRYLWPMVPAAAILVLRRSSAAQSAPLGRSLALSHAAFAWLLFSAVAIAANSFAYDVGRQREGEAAVALGYDATTVDAGYEWVGSHGIGEQRLNAGSLSLTWYASYWPSFVPCAVLSNSRLDVPRYELVRVNDSAYRQYLFIGPAQPLYLYGSHRPGCPTPHPIESSGS